MKLLELSLAGPAENIALEEALLEECEAGLEEDVLRIWESSTTFVVLGAGGSYDADINLNACDRDSVPVVRRCTGGGTVVQGPGCLNYTFVMRRGAHHELESITGTNQLILESVQRAVANVSRNSGPETVALQGISDLTFNNIKFSGNAQRRRKNHVLFHGTLLYDFNLDTIKDYLAEPIRQPEYRAGRKHEEFVRNVPVDPNGFKQAISADWQIQDKKLSWPQDRTEQLVQEKYSVESWTKSL